MGDVKLVAITKPCIEGLETANDLIAYCARVSNEPNQLNKDTYQKLLDYCMKNAHWSIFEMSHAILEINTTRDIGRQILRHRSFSFQELSARYSVINTNNFIYREARLQDKKNRQNSIEIENEKLQEDWTNIQEQLAVYAKSAYEWAIGNDIAKEQARAVLPEGMTPTRMYMSGSIRSWIHYCDLRSGNGTQKEHREIAIKCAEVLAKEFPTLFNKFLNR